MNSKLFLKAAWLPGPLSLMILGILFFRNYDLDKLDRIIASDRMELDSKRALLASVGDLRKELVDIDQGMERDYKQLFELDKAESMVEMINNMASYYGVQIVDFKFQIPEYVEKRLQIDSKAPFVIPFEGKFKGGYVAVGRFTEALEKKIFVKEINDIRLVADKASGGEVVCEIKGLVRFIGKTIQHAFDGGQIEKTD